MQVDWVLTFREIWRWIRLPRVALRVLAHDLLEDPWDCADAYEPLYGQTRRRLTSANASNRRQSCSGRCILKPEDESV